MQSAPSASRVIITSFLVDLLDVLTNFTVAVLSGSVVMIAETLQGLADLAAAGFLLIGLSRSGKPSDKKHPFGYGLELYFWTMLASVLILGVTSTMSFYFGWQRFITPLPVQNIYLAFTILTLSIMTNGYALSLSTRRLLNGKSFLRIRKAFLSSTLIETKTAFVLDLMGSLAAVSGFLALLFYQISGNLLFDGLGAMVIGGLLAIFGVLLIMPIRELIIGQSASEKVENQIRQAIMVSPEVKAVLELKTLHIGSEKLLVNAEVNLKSDLTTIDIEKIMDRIRLKIKQEVPEVKHIQVEVETP